jgi:alkanesulfonate monooxygenase SsuD/methylene tetrahydromethanopterin reductase-like flavin-dependent oxidoreductase (luciferase family)
MRFHIHLLPTYFADREPPFGLYLRNILDQVTQAEDLGWDCQWFTEHHFVPYGGPIPNPAVILAAVAARTSRIRMGCAISILPLHHPIQTAEDYAMVDALSGGRLEFGIGRGNGEIDYVIYEVERDESHERLHEAIEIIRKAWSQERFSHQGRFWNIADVTLTPRTEQQPLPPIWVAAGSPETMRWAGLNGFHIMTVAHPSPPERLNANVAAWRAALLEAGRDPVDYHNKIHLRVYVNADGEKAREVAEAAILRYENIMTVGRGGPARPTYTHASYDWEGMLAQGRNIYGNPDDCIRLIETASRNYDFNICSTTFNFGGIPHEEILKSMRLFATEVMPAFRSFEPPSLTPSAAL